MSTSYLICKANTKKLGDFKDIHKYTSSYQAIFDKVIGFLTDSFYYTHKSIEIYFQATILMNIRIKYLTLVSAILKD